MTVDKELTLMKCTTDAFGCKWDKHLKYYFPIENALFI